MTCDRCELPARRAVEPRGGYVVGQSHRLCDRHLAEHEAGMQQYMVCPYSDITSYPWIADFGNELRRAWNLPNVRSEYVTAARVGIFRNSLGWLYLSFRKPRDNRGATIDRRENS